MKFYVHKSNDTALGYIKKVVEDVVKVLPRSVQPKIPAQIPVLKDRELDSVGYLWVALPLVLEGDLLRKAEYRIEKNGWKHRIFRHVQGGVIPLTEPKKVAIGEYLKVMDKDQVIWENWTRLRKSDFLRKPQFNFYGVDKVKFYLSINGKEILAVSKKSWFTIWTAVNE